MKLEMIFFDMGGTIDLYPKDDRCVKKACIKIKKMLEDAGADQVSAFGEEEFKKIVLGGIRKYTGWRTVDYIELSPEKLFSDFILDGLGIDEKIINNLSEDMAFLIDTEFYNRIPRPEAREALEAIKGMGLRMGIISNVMSRGQVGYCLDKYGLAGYFEVIVLSAVYGKRKPHPDIFLHSCREAGVDPADVIFVGNSPSKDVAGAKKAGIGKTVFIDYFENPADDIGPEADYSIKDLRELIPIIEGLKEKCSCCCCGK